VDGVISHVVFDFDGTLADSAGLAVRLYNGLAAREGFRPLTAENLEALRSMPLMDRLPHMGIPVYRLPGLMVEVRRSFAGQMHTVDFHPGVPELLRGLHQKGLRLLILSSNDEANIRTFLSRHGVEELVDAVHGGASLFGKARMLRSLLKKERLHPEQLVYVGDEERDVEACREVGVRVIAVTWGVDTVQRLRGSKPDALAEKPVDVLQQVASW
jgi:phosphoglycolate phosphatase